MARPTNKKRALDKIKEIMSRFGRGVFGGVGLPSMSASRLTKFGSASARIRSERPSRDLDEFAYIQDILSNCPAIDYALAKLAHDASVDENGDDRGWSAMVNVMPEDDSDESLEFAAKLQRDMQKVLEAFVTRTQLGSRTKSYIRKALAAGDCFAELDITIDPSTGFGRIEAIRELPTWQMFVIRDDAGNTIGYRQTTPDTHDTVVWSIPGQIVHWKNNDSDYLPYGLTELARLRNRWEQFKLLDMDLFAAIHTRAVSPEVHYVGRESTFGDVSDDAVDRYRQKLLDDPTDINRFYVVKQGQTKISVLEGDSEAVNALYNAHHGLENRMMWALGIPLSIAGSGSSVSNRNQAAVQQSDYARRINSIRQDFSAPLYRVFAIELALAGFDLSNPESMGVGAVSIQFRWPDLSETRTQRSTRLIKEFTVGARSLKSTLYGLGEQDPEGEIATMLSERERGIFPLGSTPFATPNSQQGKGVPTGEGEPHSNNDEDDEEVTED